MRDLGLTLTGADSRTPLAELVKLADAGAEVALLATYSPDGRNRYPSGPWMEKAVKALDSRAALHVCGSRARERLIRGDLDYLTEHVGRIQVNGTLLPAGLSLICALEPNVTIITQHTEANAALLDLDLPNHALLVDASGGRGLKPDAWNRPETGKRVGFAGGLSPENLSAELPRIAEVAGQSAWVDLETGLRTDDWFDVAKAWAVVEAWKAWRAGQ